MAFASRLEKGIETRVAEVSKSLDGLSPQMHNFSVEIFKKIIRHADISDSELNELTFKGPKGSVFSRIEKSLDLADWIWLSRYPDLRIREYVAGSELAIEKLSCDPQGSVAIVELADDRFGSVVFALSSNPKNPIRIRDFIKGKLRKDELINYIQHHYTLRY